MPLTFLHFVVSLQNTFYVLSLSQTVCRGTRLPSKFVPHFTNLRELCGRNTLYMVYKKTLNKSKIAL